MAKIRTLNTWEYYQSRSTGFGMIKFDGEGIAECSEEAAEALGKTHSIERVKDVTPVTIADGKLSHDSIVGDTIVVDPTVFEEGTGSINIDENGEVEAKKKEDDSASKESVNTSTDQESNERTGSPIQVSIAPDVDSPSRQLQESAIADEMKEYGLEGKYTTDEMIDALVRGKQEEVREAEKEAPAMVAMRKLEMLEVQDLKDLLIAANVPVPSDGKYDLIEAIVKNEIF